MENILKKIDKLSQLHDNIPDELIKAKNVKLGLRNSDGTGVVAGITTKGRVVGYKKVQEGDKVQIVPSHGKLFYCNIDVSKIIDNIRNKDSFGFEEVTYLLLTGELPMQKDLKDFKKMLSKRRELSKAERSILMEEVVNDNQMYALHSVLSHMSRCDSRVDTNDLGHVLEQCINLIAKAPSIVAYNYNIMKFRQGDDLKFIRPKPELSMAENFLYMLTGEIPDKFEARVFDEALIMHAEHGGGNNSTFTVRTVSSSGANTYMAMTAGIASLSGYLHGGANESVMNMMGHLKEKLNDWGSEKAIREYLIKVLEKKEGDKTGKVYGFGHAVYTLSDPRALIMKDYADELANIKGRKTEYDLYILVEKVASELLSERKNSNINANVDFYSGFIYNMMGIPQELYTPIFAMSRLVGWSAHRIEQIIQGKIMRPAYIAASTDEIPYVKLEDRK